MDLAELGTTINTRVVAVISYLYSFSFEPNDWTREYPGQPEILNYLRSVAAKWNLYRYARFNTTLESAAWDEASKKWQLDLKTLDNRDGGVSPTHSTISADFFVSGVGQLNQPNIPQIPGLDSFSGKVMHSARWDWGYSLEGKRIAVIGNGATAIQIIPEIAKVAKSVTVFQRTPNWVVPRGDTIIPQWRRSLFKLLPSAQKRHRQLVMDFRESMHDSISKPNAPSSKMLEQAHTASLNAALPNRPDLWNKLTPDYPTGCKRVLISDDFFPAMGLPNVILETDNIENITDRGAKVENKEEEEYDLIVLATGFRTVEFLHPVNVVGRNGCTIGDIWQGKANALYGMFVEDMPNFGMLYGPNTNLGHNSIILMIESQSRYITTLIREVIDSRGNGDIVSFTPKKENVRAFNDKIQTILKTSTFAHPQCNSWYKTSDGVVTNNWPGNVVEYQKMLSVLNWRDFEVEGRGAATIQAKAPTKLGRVIEETQPSITTPRIMVGMVLVSLTLAALRPNLLRSLISS
ncbi:hypothetical protein PENVUL_c028G04831 [Penicillium vulpinum]|uniref:Uncharacterized protein n=1 Tax=Penicillium vulpinum TaxID=29845 RepID=A0A1V6RTU3_9EURO|nr:hypothetical protein PENVUL_c028G04831 [Penicillium vulpinum]